MKSSRKTLRGILLMSPAILMGIGAAQDGQAACEPLENKGIGLYDYRNSAALPSIEAAHFPPYVEALEKGKTSMTPGGDIAYILRKFPNHHRALMATSKFAQKTKQDPPPEMRDSVACWFEKAEQFRPDDAMVKAIFGIHLIQAGKPKEGASKLEAAAQISGENANIRYNLGLAYFQLKQYEQALQNAHLAYRMGFPLPGLRNMLQRAGKWREAPAEPVVSSAPADPSRADDN